MTFTKLFSSITESTIWCEPANTRLVWITMLAMSDRMGRVWASVPGLANRARVPLEDTEKALVTLMAPDRYSRTTDHEGRRIEVIDGGWRLLNYAKYREMRDHEARLEYQREWDREHRHHPTPSDKSDQIRPGPTKAEAEADTSKARVVLPRFEHFWAAWPPGERKQAKGKCLEIWRKRGFEGDATAILAHVEAAKRSADWLQGFVPAPLVYLNQRRWEGADTAPKARKVAL